MAHHNKTESLTRAHTQKKKKEKKDAPHTKQGTLSSSFVSPSAREKKENRRRTRDVQVYKRRPGKKREAGLCVYLARRHARPSSYNPSSGGQMTRKTTTGLFIYISVTGGSGRLHMGQRGRARDASSRQWAWKRCAQGVVSPAHGRRTSRQMGHCCWTSPSVPVPSPSKDE